MKGCLFCLLGRQDSNLRMSAPKADALPLGDAPLCDGIQMQLYPALNIRTI